MTRSHPPALFPLAGPALGVIWGPLSGELSGDTISFSPSWMVAGSRRRGYDRRRMFEAKTIAGAVPLSRACLQSESGDPCVRVCIVTTSYPRYPDDVSETTTGAPIRHLVAQEGMEVTVLAPGDAGAAAREQSVIWGHRQSSNISLERTGLSHEVRDPHVSLYVWNHVFSIVPRSSPAGDADCWRRWRHERAGLAALREWEGQRRGEGEARQRDMQGVHPCRR